MWETFRALVEHKLGYPVFCIICMLVGFSFLQIGFPLAGVWLTTVRVLLIGLTTFGLVGIVILVGIRIYAEIRKLRD